MKHIMCVRLKSFSIDRIRRKQKQSQRNPCSRRACSPHSVFISQQQKQALILVKTIASRQVVIDACDEARSHGIRPGMTLAEARALCAAVQHAEHQPAADAKALEGLARWMMRFSPLVAIEPPDAILLDVTGSQRLFGSFDRLIQLAGRAIARLGFHQSIAIAPTVGAAWAIASFGQPNRAVAADESLPDLLAPLPIAALRLEEELIETLVHLGIETIGQLMHLPRQTLPARFGASILLRLDQVLGRVDEPLAGIAHREPIVANLQFEAAIDSLETTEQALRILLGQVIRQLQRYCSGVRKLVVDFIPPRSPAIQKIIHLSKATCDRATLFNLLRCALESAKSNEGWIGLRLSAPVYQRIAPWQIGLLDGEEEAMADAYQHLLERLRARMGEGTVLSPQLAESHLPERSCAYVDAMDAASSSPAAPAVLTKHQTQSRPLHLLPVPRELRCMVSPGGAPIWFSDAGQEFDLAQARGPERITGIWWEGRDKTRDYFDVEDSTGRRFWIFRVLENRRWFLHGLFDC